MSDTPVGPAAGATPEEHPFRCGAIAIVGRPNVGKSTLINHLVGQKISIVSRKAQTTRHRIRGIRTDADAQYVFVDTPGFQTRFGNALNRAMNRSVNTTLADVDAVVWVLEAPRLEPADRAVLKLLPESVPVIVVCNKIDRVKDKRALLPYLQAIGALRPFQAIVPVSARHSDGLSQLLGVLRELLPEGPPMYEADDITDRSERFLAAEFIREQLFRQLGEELPYSSTVIIERFEQEGTLRHIHAAVLVDNPNQKAIVIGKGGERLKEVGSLARQEMERLFGGKVFLELWVKVKGGWADDERALRSLGYDDV